MQKDKPGCLGFLFGFGVKDSEKDGVRKPVDGSHEGNIHSGPGGYEGMGYQDGYAADYLNQGSDDEH